MCSKGLSMTLLLFDLVSLFFWTLPEISNGDP